MKNFKITCPILLFFILILNPYQAFAGEGDEVLLEKYLWTQISIMSSEERPKVGLVLGGGGARGLAHIGVIKVLEEEGIPVDIVVGTSVGALIGALYAGGVDMEEIEQLAEEIGWNDLVDLSLNPIKLFGMKHIISADKMERYIAEKIKNRRFDELDKPLALIACDIQTGERIIFREGMVAPACRASASMPGIFEPVEYRHRFLVDGGMVDNVPADVAEIMGADVIIAVNVEGSYSEYRLSNLLDILFQVISIQGSLISNARLLNADFIIRPAVGDVSIIELNRGKECMDAGVIACRNMTEEIKERIMDKTFERFLRLSAVGGPIKEIP